MAEALIHGKIVELMKRVGGLPARKKKGVPFPVKDAKELYLKLSRGMQDLGLRNEVVDYEVLHYEMKQKGAEAVVKARGRIVAEDGSTHAWCSVGAGAANDDKHVGKAVTYAMKSAMINCLVIPAEDIVDTDDEVPDTGEPAKEDGLSDATKAFIAKANDAETKDDIEGLKKLWSKIPKGEKGYARPHQEAAVARVG